VECAQGMSQQEVTIVIPTLNEAQGIRAALEHVPKQELEALGFRVSVLVVDGLSSDGTSEIARTMGAEVVSEKRRGYGRALKTGFASASGDILVTADGDGSYPMGIMPRLVKLLVDGRLDLVTTNRFADMHDGAMPFRNRVGNQILGIATHLLFGVRLRDIESGMWIARRSVLERLVLGSDGWPFSHEFKIEAICYANCRWVEVPIEYHLRLGESKLPGWQAGFQDLIHLIKKRFNRYTR
jgi:dolichol-phosphate hexosyltransferase